MNDTPTRRRLPAYVLIRSWFRFSLRTLMIVTLLAAFAVKWWMQPELSVYRQPDGALVKYSLAQAIDPATKKLLEPRRHGRYEVRDKFGRLLVRGAYENGLPTGMWTVFHHNGRRAIRGTTVSGERSGVWTARNPAGNVYSKVTYQVPNTPYPMSRGKFTAPWYAQRVGTGEKQDEQGHFSRGPFVNDMRDGEWITTDADGQIVQRVTYRLGVRHGRSLDVNIGNGTTQSGTERETYYLHGHPLPPLTDVLPRLEHDLQSGHGGQQYEALRTVVALGIATEKLLLQVLQGSDTSQQIFLLRFLARERLASDNVLRQIERLTKSAQQAVSIEAWFTLYQLAPNRRLELARQLVQHAARSELPVRYAIGYRLAQQAGPVTEALARELESGNPTVRRVVVETLAVMSFAPAATSDEKTEQHKTDLKELVDKVRSDPEPAMSAAAVQLARSRHAPP